MNLLNHRAECRGVPWGRMAFSEPLSAALSYSTLGHLKSASSFLSKVTNVTLDTDFLTTFTSFT